MPAHKNDMAEFQDSTHKLLIIKREECVATHNIMPGKWPIHTVDGCLSAIRPQRFL